MRLARRNEFYPRAWKYMFARQRFQLMAVCVRVEVRSLMTQNNHCGVRSCGCQALETFVRTSYSLTTCKKVKQSLYTPWRRLGGEEV
jgi:hypothetical protein